MVKRKLRQGFSRQHSQSTGIQSNDKGSGPFKPGRDYNERIRDRQSKNRTQISLPSFCDENEMLNSSLTH